MLRMIHSRMHPHAPLKTASGPNLESMSTSHTTCPRSTVSSANINFYKPRNVSSVWLDFIKKTEVLLKVILQLRKNATSSLEDLGALSCLPAFALIRGIQMIGITSTFNQTISKNTHIWVVAGAIWVPALWCLQSFHPHPQTILLLQIQFSALLEFYRVLFKAIFKKTNTIKIGEKLNLTNKISPEED